MYYWQEVEALQSRELAIREQFRKTPPEIGKLSKEFQATVPTENGLEFVRARKVCVTVPVWGEGPSVTLGIYRSPDPSLRTFRKWVCFDWHSGGFLASGQTRQEAILASIIRMAKHTRAEYTACACKLIEKNGGKNIN